MSLQSVLANLESLKDDLSEGSTEALEAAAAEILERSQEYVPVVSGDLRDSGAVIVEADQVTVSYGVPYAVDVHENPNSEGYGFLLRAVEETDVEGIIASFLRSRIK